MWADCGPTSVLPGVPPPSISWYKDAAVVEVEKLSRFRQRGDGGLQISGLVPDDTGMFQCFARNAAGEVQTSTYLAVTSKSALPCPAPEALPAQDSAFLQARSLLRKDAAFCRDRMPEDSPPAAGVAASSYAPCFHSPGLALQNPEPRTTALAL